MSSGFLGLGRAGLVLDLSVLFFLGFFAALWWVPAYGGSPRSLPPWYGAFLLALAWVWVLNHWPRLGTKGFLERTPWLKSKLVFLVLVTGVSLVGFVV
jgi:hypothetical protein